MRLDLWQLERSTNVDHNDAAVSALKSVLLTRIADLEAGMGMEQKVPERQKGRPKLKVGEALRLIREHELYTDKYGDFDQYCREQWGFSSQRAFELIDAANHPSEDEPESRHT